MLGIILCYLFATHLTLVLFAIVAIPYRVRDLWFSGGVPSLVAGKHPGGRTRIWGTPTAQTLGWLIYWRGAFDRVQNQRIEDHELVHVRQCGYIQAACLPLGVFLCWGWSCPGFEWVLVPWLLAWGASLFPWFVAYGGASLWSRIRHGEWYYNHTTKMGNWFEMRAYRLTDG